jgi:hypothetical protein
VAAMAWTLGYGESARPRTYSIATLEELRKHVQEACRTAMPELTLTQDGEAVLVLALNDDRAVLSARQPGTEAFLVASDPAQHGAPIQFRLANGQIDEYPARLIAARIAALERSGGRCAIE